MPDMSKAHANASKAKATKASKACSNSSATKSCK